MSIIPDRLRACVDASGLTPTEVDAKAGLPPGMTEALIQGERRKVHSGELILLSITLDCPVTDMTGDEQDTDEDRAYVVGVNALNVADAAVMLAAVYRVVNPEAREELRRAVRAIKQGRI